jgi:hypothetical protein
VAKRDKPRAGADVLGTRVIGGCALLDMENSLAGKAILAIYTGDGERGSTVMQHVP